MASSTLAVTLRYWSEDSIAGSDIERALFKMMELPGGGVLARRPPAEAAAQLTDIIRGTPSHGDLYAIRAEEEERNLQIDAAENDWRQAADLATDRAAGLIDLADFYQRRLEPVKEIGVLVDAGKLASTGMDRYRSNAMQREWHAFERANFVWKNAGLAAALQGEIFEAWIARYPNDREPYSSYLDALVQSKEKDAAQTLVNRIAAQFSNESEFRLETEAKLASIDGGEDAELNVYATHFSPLWPAPLLKRYYDLLSNAHQLRSFSSEARQSLIAAPNALDPVLRLFFYCEQGGSREAADQELLAFRSRVAKSYVPLSADDLRTIAALFERTGNYNEAARASYEIYEMASGAKPDKEEALAALIELLLDVPEQPLRLGERDLSLYRNIAQMDDHPGFLNGILSLALNTTFPQFEYQNASQSASTYFHRAAASRLLEVLKQQFPQSNRAGLLEAKLFGAYAAYGQDEAVIRFVPVWLSHNSASSAYVNSAMLLADAYSHTNRASDEFALYDKLLTELAAQNGHVPLGPDSLIAAQRGDQETSPRARSADYSRVLDRYIARLTQTDRVREAIALYQKEIARNPDDPGLYQRLALFVEQNRLDNQLAETYRAAFNRFKDDSWASKLARLYLRRKQYTDYQALTREITDTFKGSELAKFVNGIEPNQKLNPELYRQINLYAHQRFPHNLTFVKNLLSAYQAKATADPAAYEKLLRENWFYSADLRRTFFEYLSRTGELSQELAALPTIEAASQQSNVAAIQMKAEGSAWLTDFESSSGAFVKLAEFAPGDRAWNDRAIAVERSLAASTPGDFERAVALAEQDVKAAPADSTAITRVGEIYADQELYAKAAPWWDRLARLHPGSPEGYLEGATVFWDYYQFDSALRLIDAARAAFHQPARFAYEAGAICENQGNFSRAVDEYVKAALEQPSTGRNGSAENRLIALARRKSTADIVEKRTAAIVDGVFNGPALQLRIAILENQGRRDDIHTLLGNELSRANSIIDLEEIKQDADRLGFDDTASQALTRAIALTTDPVEKIKARVDLALYKESHRDPAEAEQDLTALLKENPELLGVIRADVNFLWRQREYRKAVTVLSAAASRAQQPFQTELRREAAQKAADSGDFDAARRLLDQLLSASPYNGDLLAQKAATYAQARDNGGLAQFYSGELKMQGNSSLPAQEKADRIASLRRGYIPALIATQQFSEALTQYEQLLNQFPEDESLAIEAARFSAGQPGNPLVSYYEKATLDSPHNYRWPLLLARIDSALGRFAEAITAYEKAAYVRPDRIDILIAKGDLETRLLRFKDGLKTNQKLYDLSYHDTRFLTEQATLYERLQNPSEALRLLRVAYVDPNPKDVSGYMSVINQLMTWRLFTQVDATYKELLPLIEKGNASAGDAVALEAQALTSLHHLETAIHVVAEAWQRIKGLQTPENTNRFSAVIGAAVKAYLEPAKKNSFAAKISVSKQAGIDTYRLANAAGLLDLAADLLTKRLAAEQSGNWNALQQLQNSRLNYGPLGHELETLAQSARQEAQRDTLLRSAIEAYGNAGDFAEQIRIANSLGVNNHVIDPAQYAQLFLRAPGNFQARLDVLAKRNLTYADAVVQQLLNNGSEQEVMEALRTRGAYSLQPWSKSYSALAGLYFLSSEPQIGESFNSILGPRTVGAELAQLGHSDNNVLRGDLWFYYAARYGDYQEYRERDAVDLLPAYLEGAPAASKGYVDLGDTYLDTEHADRALSLYQEALQLSPESAGIYDRMAVVQARAGHSEDAIDSWRSALHILATRVEEGPLPADYWQTARTIFIHANQFKAIEKLRSDAEAMIRAYAKRNGAYNFSPFIDGILKDAPDQARTLDWILQIARETNVISAVEEFANSQWIPEERKDAVYRFLIERAQAQVSASFGDAANAAVEQLQRAQINYVTYLLAQNRAQEAWQILEELQPRGARPPVLELRAAALTGRLKEELASFRSQPESAPTGDQILVVASELETGHPELALALKEFEYQRELDAGSAPASAYFGLAKVRIAQKRPAEAKSLIRTVTVSVGTPFENLPAAVNLLEGAGMSSEASEYAAEWATAEPWNPEAQLRSARLKRNGAELDSIRQSTATPYSVRAEAAIGMRTVKLPANGTDELALLTHTGLTPQEASQPFFVYARLYAAKTASKNEDRIAMLRQAIALDPTIQDERLDLAAAAFTAQQIPLALAALESYSSASSGSTTRATMLLQVREQAAGAMVSQKDFGRAIGFYDQILAALPTDSERARIENLRNAVQTTASLAALNAGRQPVITEALTQPSRVKPKLASLPSEGIDQ